MTRLPLGFLLLALPAAAQPLTPQQREEVVAVVREALRTDPSILRDAAAALEVDEIRLQEAAARDALAAIKDRLVDPADPVAGNPLGDVTVVEFYDTRCPYCRRMKPVLADLLRLDPNLRLVVKDMPVLGPASQLESRALLAAQRQGGYFKLQAAVMAGAGQPDRDTLRAEARHLGLDDGALLRDMDDPAIKSRLEANVAVARALGLKGVPGYVIGGQVLPGAVNLATLQQAVAEARALRLGGISPGKAAGQ